MTGGARRRTIGEPGPPSRGPGYRAGVHAHDPFSHRQRGYTVPQLDPDPAARPVRDGRVKILAIVDRYAGLPGKLAGGEMMLHHLLRDSVRRGHEAIVATATPVPFEIEGVAVVPNSDVGDLGPTCDVVIGHLMWTRLAVETAGRHGRPCVYLVHNDQQLHHWKLVPHNVTSVVWNSAWVHDLRAGSWGGPGEIIAPPVFVEDYAVEGDPWNRPYVTLVNGNPEKGGQVLLDLAAGPPARDYLMVEGGYGEQLRPGPKHPNVTWQPQTVDMVGDVYAHTRVLVMPSQYESWGRAAIEAMASGIPVVAAPTPGLRESLGDAALYADVADLSAWRAALAKLDSASTYRHWSERALARAAELSARSRLDLDRWDRVIREAAALVPASETTSRVPSSA